MIRHATFPACLVALAASPVWAGDRAVIVGIDDYPDLALSQPLTGAKADAERFGAFLTGEMGFDPADVTLLTDAGATSTAIMAAVIDRLVAETAPGDRAVFYFAGLGSRLAAPDGGTNDVLLAHDAPSVLGNIPRDALAEIFDLLAEQKVTVVIDASFRAEARDIAGSLATERSLRLDTADRPGTGAGPLTEVPFGAGSKERAVWNAAAPDQFAWEAGGQGVFTQRFMEGIGAGAADANGNGTITNAELLTFLRDQSESWCAATADCAAEGGALIPSFDGPLQDVSLRAAPPAPQPAAPEIRPLPESTLLAKDLDLTDTLGFVTDLFTPSNAANLKLGLSRENPLRIGDTVRFSVTADRPGTLVLLDVNPKGELAQIFPSGLARTGTTRIAAGEVLTIPNGKSGNGAPLEIRVTEPHGKGFLLGLFIEDDLPRLTAILPENLEGGPIPNAGQYLYEIAQDLLRLQADASGSSAPEWSATYLPYEILP
ncbi:caspase family protein [Defluviimonas sp. SAOS-178_SWC]|uniref:caspase family protein n=1 Tax=Defluviimonas sp. SAOS-178_SWC TaxID=3121287 RepID=UPI003221F40A